MIDNAIVSNRCPYRRQRRQYDAVDVATISLLAVVLLAPAALCLGQHGHRSCAYANPALAAFVEDAVSKEQAGEDHLLPVSTTFEGFLADMKSTLDKHIVDERAHLWLFDDNMTHVHPTCAGDWMEFGVFQAGSINHSARWRRTHCGWDCSPLWGFDTFTGLPEVWSHDGSVQTFGKGAFSLGGQFPPVESNVQLVKGLFSESLPPLLRMEMDLLGAREGHPRALHGMPLSYVHVDCDLYAGAHDIFTQLDAKIVPGTIILFDEIVNYQAYRDHEAKAFFEWLMSSNAKVAAIAIKGPLEGTHEAMDLNLKVSQHHQHQQGAAFVVVSRPGSHGSIGW